MNDRDRLRRYATLLRLRKRQEDERAKVFAAERTTQAALARDREQVESRQRALLATIGEMASDRPEPRKLYAAYQYERHLSRVRDACDSNFARQQVAVDTARQELESAIGQRRIMEKLIENTKAELAYTARRREQRMHDEISVLRYARATRRIRDEDSDDSHSGDHGVSRGAPRPGRPQR